MVFNQLKAAVGASTSLPYSVYVSFEDARFSIPAPKVPPMGPQRLQMMSLMGTALGGAAKALANKILPKNIIGDALDKVTDGLGMDYPNNTLMPGRDIIRKIGYQANMTQIDQIEKLDWKSGDDYPYTMDMFKTEVAETEMEYLIRRPALSQTINWPESLPRGSLLGSFLITPWPNGESAMIFPPGAPFNVTPIEYHAHYHTFWRGALTFRFQVIASQYHSGKLIFCVNYGVKNNPVSIEAASNQYTVVMDIGSGKRDYIFDVDYQALTKVMRVMNYPGGFDSIDAQSSLGVVSIWVLNKLVVTGGVSPSVDVNVYKGAGKDFEFFRPEISGNTYFPSIIQGDEDSQKVVDPDSTMHADMSVGTGKVTPRINLVGSRTENLIDLMKAYTPCGTYVLVQDQQQVERTGPYSTRYASFDPCTLIISLETLFGQTKFPLNLMNIQNIAIAQSIPMLWQKIIQPYRWMRGGLKFKAIIRAEISNFASTQGEDTGDQDRLKVVNDATHTGIRTRASATHVAATRWVDFQDSDKRAVFKATMSNLLPRPAGVIAQTTTAPPVDSEWSINDMSQIGATKGMQQTAGRTTYTEGTTAILEFETPHTSAFNFLLARPNDATYDPTTPGQSNIFNNGTIVINMEPGETPRFAVPGGDLNYINLYRVTFTVDLFVAVADDFHLGGYIGVPSLNTLTPEQELYFGTWPDRAHVDD